MGTKTLIIDIDSLLSLLQHYSEGQVPLDAKVLGFGASARLGRVLGLELESSQWDRPADANGMVPPLYIRYAGSKILRWSKGQETTWKDAITKNS